MAMTCNFCRTDFCQPLFLAETWLQRAGGLGPRTSGPLQLGLALLVAFCTLLVSPVLVCRLSHSPLSALFFILSLSRLCSFFLQNILLNSWLFTTVMELQENSHKHYFFERRPIGNGD